LLATFTVRVDVPEVKIEAGLRLAVNPVGAVADNVTLPVNPLRAVIVIVEVPDDPLLTLKEVGDAEIEKSGVVTCTVTPTVWLNDPHVPFTVTEYGPLLALLGTVTFSVDWPGAIIHDWLRLAVQPFGAVVESVTLPVNPLRAVIVIVEVLDDPFPMLKDVGDADIEKSGEVEGVKLVVTGLPKPVTRS